MIIFCAGFFVLGAGVGKASAAITDSFTDAQGVLLENHTSDSGNTWSRQAGTGTASITNANRLVGNATTGLVAVSNWTPASADYDVSADLYFVDGNINQVGVMGRAGVSSFTGYIADLKSPNSVVLYRAGNATPLGTYTTTFDTGSTHTIKLSMRGSNIQVYWDNVSVINVTPTGADLISITGVSGVYLQGAFTNTTGIHVDNFLADNPATLTAGVLSETTHTSSSATVSWTNVSGGTTPITAQLQRSPSGAGTWSNVGGATASPVTDTGLSASTAYDYRVVYTDATPTTVYSNIVTITTSGSTTTYTVQQTDLWDNGYDNVSAPRQSNFAHFIFTTNAASVTIGGTTSMYTSYPQFSHLGVRVNGVNQSSLIFTTNGSQSFSVSLGTAGTTRTVEIISGAQSKPSSTVIGSFIDSVTYANTASFSVTAPTAQTNRILVYGDSIAAGGNATNPEIEAYVPLLRDTYGHSVMMEAWGFRALYDDTNTSGLRSAFVSRIAGYTPATIWLAIGTNDYGLSKQNATNFGTVYATTLDDLHTALPSARVICQTPIVRSSESANSFGNTLSDYRNQITNICNARPWALLVDGTDILTTSDLADGVHPSTAGHAKYALAIDNFLDNIDTIAPDTLIDSNPNSNTSSTSATFTFHATETSTFQCKLDSGSYASCTSPKNYTALAEGDHTFSVKATDTANNEDQTPASYTWTVDTTSPTISFSENVEAGPVPSDIITADWGDASIKKWEYNSNSTCSTNASDYSKTDTDSINQTTQENNTKYICLYAEDALGNKATLASSNPINISLPVVTTASKGDNDNHKTHHKAKPKPKTFQQKFTQKITATKKWFKKQKTTINRNLSLGSRGQDVGTLQTALQKLGLLQIKDTTYGVYKTLTQEAVTKLQQLKNIFPTGNFGVLTRGLFGW